MEICNRFQCKNRLCPYHYLNADEPGYFKFMDLSSVGCGCNEKIVFSPVDTAEVELLEKKIKKYREHPEVTV